MRKAAGNPATLRLLLDAGAHPQRTFALATALEREAPETVRLLLDRLPAGSGERAWSLLWAVEHGRSEAMIRLLADHGADLEAIDEANDRTPYRLAIRTGRRDLAELLAELGAERRVEPIDELLGACFSGHAAEAQRLAGAHPDALALLRGAYAGALPHAAAGGNATAVEILLGLGVPADTRAESGQTALAVATGDAAQVLLPHGARPTAPQSEPQLPPRRDPSEPDYAELGWAAEIAYLRVLASSPLVESRPCGDGFAVRSGIGSNTENGVVCDRADDATIADTLAWLGGAPAQWFVGAGTDLPERLVAAGATPERTAVVMGARLDAPLPERPAPVEIVPVRTAELLAASFRIVDDDERHSGVLASLDLGPAAPIQHRVALKNGYAAGAATTLLDGDTLYGLHLAVAPEHRRAGIGGALMSHVLHESGAHTAVLAPTPQTTAFYRSFGFVLRPHLRERSFYLP